MYQNVNYLCTDVLTELNDEEDVDEDRVLKEKVATYVQCLTATDSQGSSGSQAVPGIVNLHYVLPRVRSTKLHLFYLIQ